MINATEERTRVPHAASIIQLGRRVLFLVGSTVLGLMLVWLWMSWQATKQAQLQRMGVATTLIAAQVDGYFGSLAKDMELLTREIKRTDALHRPAVALEILKQFKSDHPDLGGGTLILPSGQMFASTAGKPGKPLPNVLANAAWREDFHSDLMATGLSVNRPQLGYLLNQWLIPLRYTVRDDSGQVIYLLQTSILLERQQNLWRSLSLPENAAIGLLRHDGYLISRWPNDASGEVYRKQTLNGALYKATRTSPDGIYEGTVVDGSYRFGSYSRLGQGPLYAFLSLPRKIFISAWWQQVRFPVYLMFAVLLVSMVGYLLLAKRYGMRMRAIETHLRGAHSVASPPSSGVREIDQLVTALADTQEQLRVAARNREKLLLAAVDAGTYAVRERDGVIVSADDAFTAMLGKPREDLLNGRLDDYAIVEAQGVADRYAEDLTRSILRVRTEEKPRWIAIAEYREAGADGEVLRHGLAIDVTAREHLLAQVNAQSQRLQSLWKLATNRGKSDREKMQPMLRLALEALGMDVVLVNELRGEQLVIHELADDLHLFQVGQEFPVEDALCRHAISNKNSFIAPDLHADPVLSRNILATLGFHGFASIPVWAGPSFYGTVAFMRRAPLDEGFSSDDRAFMELLGAWFGQIMLERQQRTALHSLAMTDGLTHLVNRRAAEIRIAEEFARARREEEVFSVAVCDLDRFKLVNDHYGHDVGDQVLLHVAGILKAELREGEWVARWGGEEFLIFLHRSESASARTAMERLRLAIKGNPVTTAHGPLNITTSIGIGTFHGQGELAEIMSEADGCLFEAKRSGRDRVVVSDSSHRGLLWRAGMLQHALLENRIVPAYQVMVDLRTNEVVADEALARLIEPDGRIVTSGEFVEAAEGINLIHLVDEVIARQSVERCAASAGTRKFKPGFAHFINLSSQFLARRELVQALLHQSREQCVSCGMREKSLKPLVLEITERQLLGNFEGLLNDLQPLLDYGFRLALDDFGSGYSSFLYLAKLPVSFLKIEGWMTANLRTNSKVLSMVQSIIQLARQQGITTIAEYVEDGETAELLRDLGVDWGQGYHFGRPECEIDTARLVRSARSATR
jgi:diguanylate cyclase (GGDEF)-like protein